MSRQSIFVSRHSFVKARSSYAATQYFCVLTEFGLKWGFYVATELSYAVTKFGLDKGF